MLIFAALAQEQPNGRTRQQRDAGNAASVGPRGMDTVIDEYLIVRTGQGDRAAFERLYEETSNAVYAYALSLLLNRENAEDVMQETFLKIRAAAHLYKPQGKPMAWILTIARNLCMMRFRQEKRQTELLPEHMEEECGLSDIKESEDRLVLETALRILSQEELRIIVLHAVSGMKHREISEVMNLPLSTVLSRYQRGLGKLRKKLEERNT